MRNKPAGHAIGVRRDAEWRTRLSFRYRNV